MDATDRHPYLSVVVTARNDDHGGRLLHRMQLFVENVIGQCNRHDIDAELILVEWNPPSERPRLSELLRWPEQNRRCRVRVIEVPNDVHRTLRHSERLPLFQMIAKNVGIRRASGDFVLATNVDVLLSDELAAFIATRSLESGVLYRVDRYDVDGEIEEGAPVTEQLATAESSVIRICRRDGTLDLRDGAFYRIYDSLYYLPWWIGIPIRLVRDLWRPALTAPARYPYRAVRLLVTGPARLRRALRRSRGDASPTGLAAVVLRWLDQPLLRPLGYVLFALLLAWRVATFSIERVVMRFRLAHKLFILERSRVKLHTNASGDFELLARPDWARTNGYAEFEMYSMHLDSLHMYEAHWSGIRERYLPYKLFHLEHDGGFKPDPLGSAKLNERLESDAIRQISNEQLFDWIVDMAKARRPLVFGDERWGFADDVFPETTIDAHVGAVA
jgi:hypothetical protein